jgi:hypothetical protein
MEPLKFSTTGQMATSHGVKACIYGNAGVGKTMLCATAPRPLLVMAENGTLSLTRKNIERVFGAGNPAITYDIPFVKIKDLAQFKALYDRLWVDGGLWHSFDSLYIDSATEIVEQILLAAEAENRDGRAAYGEMFRITRDWFKKFRDLPGKHVFLTCEQGQLVSNGLFGPSMPGNMLDQKVPYLFDEILQMAIGEDPQSKEPFRFLRTQPDLKNYAKDRSGALDPRGESPYLYNIINKISAA